MSLKLLERSHPGREWRTEQTEQKTDLREWRNSIHLFAQITSISRSLRGKMSFSVFLIYLLRSLYILYEN